MINALKKLFRGASLPPAPDIDKEQAKVIIQELLTKAVHLYAEVVKDETIELYVSGPGGARGGLKLDREYRDHYKKK